MKIDPDAKKQNRTLLNTIEHHGNRLYGFMGLQSKMSEWVSGFEEKEGVMGSEGAIGAEEDEGAAIYLMFDG